MPAEIDSTPSARPPALRLRVIGVGGAGGRLADLLADADCVGPAVAVDTDTAALSRLGGVRPVNLGERVQRGLGCGGDAAHAREVAEQGDASLRPLVEGGGLVILLVGLGGGVGSGIAPVLARLAREAGALVMAVAALPFEFEGRLRSANAGHALMTLKGAADVVITVPNQGVIRLVPDGATAEASLAAANRYAVEVVQGLRRMISGPALVPLGVADLERVLRGRQAEGIAAFAEAGGDQRAREVWRQLETHPYLAPLGRLAEAEVVLLYLTGGPDLQLEELEWLQQEAQRRAPRAQVVMGASSTAAADGRLSALLVVTQGGGGMAASTAREAGAEPAPRRPAPLLFEDGPAAAGRGGPVAIPETPGRPTAPIRLRSGSPAGRNHQQQFDFASPWRGRFENAEGTLRGGENLDEPTFARRGVKLN